MGQKEIIFGLIFALVLAVFVSPFASPFLDGLERVAKDKGFLEKGEKAIFNSPVADYLWPGIKNESRATSVAGVVGTLVTFAVGWGLALLIKRS